MRIDEELMEIWPNEVCDIVEWKIGPMAYRLKLPHWMKQLYPVFNVVKLTLALDDLITGQCHKK